MAQRGKLITGLACLVFLAGLVPALAGAAEKVPVKPLAPDREITLQEAVDMALSYSPGIAQAMEEISRAKAAQSEAFTYYLPTLATGYSWEGRQNANTINFGGMDITTSDKNTYVWRTQVDQPVFTGFRISSNYNLATLGVDVAEMERQLSVLDMVYRTKQTYFNHLRALKALDVARESIGLLKSQLKTTKDFNEVGILPINDVLKVEVELADAVLSEVRADNEVSLSRSRLNTLLGLKVDANTRIKDILAYEPVEVEFASAKEKARVQRPELQSLELKIQQSEQLVRNARSEYYPQVGLQGYYDFMGDSPDLGGSDTLDASDWTVAAQVSISLWEWGRTGHKVGQAQAERQKLNYAYQDTRDQVDLSVKEAYLFLRDSEKSIFTAKTAIKQAEENYRITQERYNEQLTTNTELLDAQYLLTRARNNYFTALSTYNIANAGLLRAMGQR